MEQRALLERIREVRMKATFTPQKKFFSHQNSTTSSLSSSPLLNLTTFHHSRHSSISSVLLPYLRQASTDTISPAPPETDASTHLSESFAMNPVLAGKRRSTTEMDLDAFGAESKQRRSKNHKNSQVQHEEQPKVDPTPETSKEQQSSLIYLLPSGKRRKTLKRVYVNLPKLPFGKHKSYNEEVNISSKFVLSKTEARLRKRSDVINRGAHNRHKS